MIKIHLSGSYLSHYFKNVSLAYFTFFIPLQKQEKPLKGRSDLLSFSVGDLSDLLSYHVGGQMPDNPNGFRDGQEKWKSTETLSK